MNEEIFTLKMLFLDDIRYPQDAANYIHPVELRPYYRQCQVDIVRNYKEFVEYFKYNEMPDIISFDHDLADQHYAPMDQWEKYDEWAAQQHFKEETGYDCAKFLINYCQEKGIKLPTTFCHSMNPVGKENILNLLNGRN